MWFIFFIVLMVLLSNKLIEEPKAKELTHEEKTKEWKKSVGWRE